jgi:hypothetical protein
MKPQRIEGYTRVVGLDQRYHPLHILDRPFEDGTPCMVTAWKPTPEELEKLVSGACVQLSILGNMWPPVLLEVTEPA